MSRPAVHRTEPAPGVHRLAFAIGAKPMAMYLLDGEWLTIVDTGLPDTPAEVYLPAVRALGRDPREVRLALITHADADHIGGNHALREVFPNALLACHPLDARWASDPAVITAERYDALWDDHRIRYERAVLDTLDAWMGPARPMDLLLPEGTVLRSLRDGDAEIVHLPGHTHGHIGLFDAGHGWLIAGDAVFGKVQRNVDGSPAAPPPYIDIAAYRATIDRIRALAPSLLLTCHYPPMAGAEIGAFLDESAAFIDRAEAATERILREAGGSVTLAEAIARGADLLGPFGFDDDLKYAMLPHLELAESRGLARRLRRDGILAWEGTAGPEGTEA